MSVSGAVAKRGMVVLMATVLFVPGAMAQTLVPPVQSAPLAPPVQSTPPAQSTPSVQTTPARPAPTRISNPVAVFSGLDKITGKITEFDAYINETVQFGSLQVTPRVCYSSDDSEAQHVDGFVQVDEITLDRRIRQIFSGWMFADSPALNAVEHPIYDVWLKDCKQKSDVPKPVKD
ncbi:DUF2155 domain-containing protein [Allorhizobium sp. BGMRC 0089]|uniref:DUF2155 domain-containing protein n=1 Tax=Allorhizobium sonneratiae TaxID=2934936 RepID=UPI0020346F14|nr:DUF2155 domain-containing protein [Allorhizobium sonneratiae]MCM2294302.1 DUF2155 domain-containing protein [Allorhizobium sonneratiae]